MPQLTASAVCIITLYTVDILAFHGSYASALFNVLRHIGGRF